MKQCSTILMMLLCVGSLAKGQQVITWKPLTAKLQTKSFLKQEWNPFKQTIEVKPVAVTVSCVNVLMADSYYQQCFGFFCKREWELQQKVHIPVKLRLGTYQLTRMQEGY